MTVNKIANFQTEWSQIERFQQANSKTPENKEAIRKLSEEFEGIFLEIVLKSMRETVSKSELIDGGNGEEIFQSMLDSEYAKSMAAQRSTGLATSIETHLLGMMNDSVTNEIDKAKIIAKYQGISQENKR